MFTCDQEFISKYKISQSNIIKIFIWWRWHRLDRVDGGDENIIPWKRRNGISMKAPLLLTLEGSEGSLLPVEYFVCRSRQVPPHQLGRKIGQGLGRDDSHCCSVQWVWITLGKRTPSRKCCGSHILRKEVPCGDYTYGLVKGSATYGSLWGRLNQPGVRSLHSRVGRRSRPGKYTG